MPKSIKGKLFITYFAVFIVVLIAVVTNQILENNVYRGINESLKLVPVLFMVFFIGVFITENIMRPLKSLSNQAEVLSTNLNKAIRVRSNTKEIESLGKSIEHLRRSTKSQINYLEVANIQLRTIENLAIDIQSTMSLSERLLKIVKITVDATKSCCASLTVFNMKNGIIYAKESYRSENKTLNYLNKINSAKKCREMKNDIEIHNEYFSKFGIKNKDSIKSKAIIRFIIDEKYTGVLEISSKEKGHFSKNVIGFLTHISKTSSVSLYNAILYKRNLYSKKFAETVLDNHPICTVVINYPEIKVIKVSDSFKKEFNIYDLKDKNLFEGFTVLKDGFLKNAIEIVNNDKKPLYLNEKKIKFNQNERLFNIGLIPTVNYEKVHNIIITIQECTKEIDLRNKLQNLLSKQSQYSDELESIVTSLQCGLIITKKDGKIVSYNKKYLEIFEAEQLLNMESKNCLFEDLRLIDESGVAHEDCPERRILREPFFQELYIAKSTKGNDIYISVNGAALKNRKGISRGGVFTVENITQLMKTQDKLKNTLLKKKEWQEKLKILNNTTLELSKVLDVDKILEITARAAKELTDSNLASTYRITEDQKRIMNYCVDIPRNYKNKCFVDESKFVILHKGSLYSKCLREGKPQIINDIDSYSEKKSLPKGHLPLKGLLVLPYLSSTGKVVGLLYLSDKRNNQKYTVEDKNIVHSLSVHTSVAIKNALNIEREREISHLLQKSLLPILPSNPNIDFDYAYEAATSGVLVGGDFFDAIELGEDKICMVIADVAGKGIEAATLTSTIKNTVRAFAQENLSPGDIMTRTNKALCSQGIPNFITAIIGILDINMGKLAYANAGHHPPVIYNSRLGNAIFLQSGSCPLGVIENEIYEDFTSEVNVNDMVMLYTDGLVEARRNGKLFGEHRLMKSILKNGHRKRPVSYIIDEVEKFSGKKLQDDIAVLTAKLLNLPSNRSQLNLRLGRLFNN